MLPGKIALKINKVFEEHWHRPFLFGLDLPVAMTYASFYTSIIILKERLRQNGLLSGDRCCVILPNSAMFLVLYMAAASSGIVLVPVDPWRGHDEVRDILKIADCQFLLAQDKRTIEGLKTLDTGALFNGLLCAKADTRPSPSLWGDLDSGNLFLITFTSGTSGEPKGIQHSFKNLFLSAEAFAEVFEFGPGNIFYHNLSMAYMAGILNLFVMPLICASSIVIGERYSVAGVLRFWEGPIKYRANTFWFIPTIAAMLLKMDRGGQGIEYAHQQALTGLIGTAPLSEQLKGDFEEKYNIPLYESYGLSETLFVTSNYPGFQESEKSTGPPLKGVELSFGEDGEIGVRVPWMFLGYAGSKEGRDVQSPFLTGDLGALTGGKALKITGRKKDIIIRGGVNISPRRIEDLLMRELSFEEAAIVGVEDQVLGEKTVCFVALKTRGSTQENNKAAWNERIVSALGRDYTVDDFIYVDSIPRNINGKVDRNILKERYGQKKSC